MHSVDPDTRVTKLVPYQFQGNGIAYKVAPEDYIYPLWRDFIPHAEAAIEFIGVKTERD